MITINSKQKKLIVVVPAYNEADRIVETIRSIFSVTAKLATDNVISLIYVVDDGSTDNTYKLACEAGANRVLRHRVNQGLGAAIRTGLLAARADEADIVVKLDADLQHDPGDIFALIRRYLMIMLMLYMAIGLRVSPIRWLLCAGSAIQFLRF